jgi:hypothetical protein
MKEENLKNEMLVGASMTLFETHRSGRYIFVKRLPNKAPSNGT